MISLFRNIDNISKFVHISPYRVLRHSQMRRLRKSSLCMKSSQNVHELVTLSVENQEPSQIPPISLFGFFDGSTQHPISHKFFTQTRAITIHNASYMKEFYIQNRLSQILLQHITLHSASK